MTNKGFSVSNKAALGQTKFTTTRAVSTDVDLSSYKEEDLKNLTKLPGEVDSGSISDYEIEGNNVSAIKIDFNNSNFTDGYTVRAVGIYAKEENGEEFLHSLTVSDTPVIIPAASGNVFDGFILTVAIFTGNNKNISIKLADENTATVKYVDDKYKAAISYTDEQVKLLNNKIANIDLSGAVKSANNYTDGKFSAVDNKIANIDLSGAVKSANNYTDSKVAGLNISQYAKNADVDSKISNIDLSKPEKNANSYTDNKVSSLNINQYAKATDVNSLFSILNGGNGSMVFRKEIEVGIDWNTIIEPGIYSFNDNGNQHKNAPWNFSGWGSLIVFRGSNDVVLQVAYSLYGDNRIYYRTFSAFSLGNGAGWKKMLSNDDLGDIMNSFNQVNANIEQAEKNAKAYADSKVRYFDNDNDAIEAGKNLPAGTLIIVRG